MTHPPKYPSTPHTCFSLTVHQDDSYHPDESIFLDREVVITEKLDGGNTCLWHGQVYARSIAGPAGDGWFAMVKKWHAHKTNDPGLDAFVFNGEDLYGIHSIQYDPIREDQTFRLFSVRQFRDDTLYRLSWDQTREWADLLEVPCVPVLFRGRFQHQDEIRDWFHSELHKPSSLGGPREGFVLRTTEEFPDDQWWSNSCKFVRQNHVQTDQHWRVNWQPCPLIPMEDHDV